MQAEVKSLQAKVTTSMDKMYRIVLETNDPQALELEKFIAEEVVNIRWEEDG